MKRSELKRRTPLARSNLPRHPAEVPRPNFLAAPSTRKRRAKVPDRVALEVAKRSGGRCVVCGRKSRQMTRHHVLPVQSFPALELVAANMVLVCWAPCHVNHESAHRRIRWTELPECAITLAYATSGAAAVYLERTYPRRFAPCPPFDADHGRE